VCNCLPGYGGLNCDSSSKDLSIIDPANDERNNIKDVQVKVPKATTRSPGPTTTAFYYEYEDFLTIPDYGNEETTKATTHYPNPILSSATRSTMFTILSIISFGVAMIFLF
jgi:hypothetical protein